jgi:hypothetical protein
LESINNCIKSLLGLSDQVSDFAQAQGTTRGFAQAGPFRIENDGSSATAKQLKGVYESALRTKLPEGNVLGLTGGASVDGVITVAVFTVGGKQLHFSPLLNYTASDIGTAGAGSGKGVFSLTLENQLHELAHSLLDLRDISDAINTPLDDDVGDEFAECIGNRYRQLTKPKKKKAK